MAKKRGNGIISLFSSSINRAISRKNNARSTDRNLGSWLTDLIELPADQTVEHEVETSKAKRSRSHNKEVEQRDPNDKENVDADDIRDSEDDPGHTMSQSV